VETLAAEGHDPLEVAAAALKLARAEEKQRPIAPVNEVQEARHSRKERLLRPTRSRRSSNGSSHERGMVRLVMNVGKTQGVRPNDVVGTIAYHAEIPGRVIGAIHIQDKETLVDVPEAVVPQVLAKTGSYRIRKTAVTITPAS
jgi:ATP-dependent RNA helicase DeaD